MIFTTCFCSTWAEDNAPNFPRLGMWWPIPIDQFENPTNQFLNDVARYDFIILFDYEEKFIAPLKAKNSNLIILNSTNACELSYNDEITSNIPAEWFLTQVGSTLTTNINATTTSIKVAKLSVTDGTKIYSLFEPGDTALIEGESLKILAVNKSTKTLTVERGHVRPASTHTVGTRIAAHISFWPNSWLLNVSTLSPTATLDQAVGAERWSDYNARVGAGIMANPGWDGLLIDRADPDQSWLANDIYARTIDPDQSNTLITNYTSFNNAWNEGLRNYQSKLRELLGSGKILFSNWGINNYDLINGNNYEAFPLEDGSSFQGTWHETVFGSLPNIGNYTQWVTQGVQPNLTMIETYEDDNGPDPGDLTYLNPCDDQGFVPNYRKMRFGLTTALLNDGYFSWEINTNGHGSLCLKWFDEYDNVGQERGYLDQPLGAAYQPSGLTVGPNQIVDGDFENTTELNQWVFWADSSSNYAATISLDTVVKKSGTSSARINITQAPGVDWRIALSYSPLVFEKNKDYTISFWAKADRKRDLSMWAELNQTPRVSFISTFKKELNTNWKFYEYTAKSKESSNQSVFRFGFGEAIGSVWIDDIRINKGSRDVWRRDYAGGSVVVNATNEAKTIDLGQALRKMSGTQVPTINDGSIVTQVTIPPLDGLVFLPVPCTSSPLNLLHNKWQQVSLPCRLPKNSKTVQAVFGNAFNGVYGTDWGVYSFDTIANKYNKVGLNDNLTQGLGYWVIHLNGSAVSLNMPVGSTQTPITPSNTCVNIKGCFSIPLTTKSNDVQWNMTGYPFTSQVAPNRWRVVTKSGACINGCTLDQAETHNIVHDRVWRYNGTAYDKLQNNALFNPWHGFWTAVLEGANNLEPRLEIPVD